MKLCGSSRPGDERAGAFVKEYVAWGAGPRGSQFLVLAAKARALLEGRTVPTIEDVRAAAIPVLRHRIIANHRAVGDSIGSARSSTICCARSPHEPRHRRPIPRPASPGRPVTAAFCPPPPDRRLL